MAHSKLYIKLMNSREWKRTRAAWLTGHPLCARCAAQGYVTAARCVHHITPVESGHTENECRQLAFSPSNLQALCIACHAEIHKAERSHSKESHQQRERDRLQAWIDRHKGGKTFLGGGDGSPEAPAETERGGDIF